MADDTRVATIHQQRRGLWSLTRDSGQARSLTRHVDHTKLHTAVLENLRMHALLGKASRGRGGGGGGGDGNGRSTRVAKERSEARHRCLSF